MKRIRTLIKAVLLVIIFFISTSVYAQDGFELLNVDYNYSIASGENALESRGFGAQVSVPVLLRKNFFVFATPSYRRTTFENSNGFFSGNSFYQVSVPFFMNKPLSETRSLSGLISVGLASDFEDISTEDMVITAAAFISNNKNPRFQFSYGLLFSRQVNGNIIFPVFSFSWQPTDRLFVDASNPIAPDISYQLSRDLRAGIGFEQEGGLYNLSEDDQNRYIEDRRSDFAPYVEYNLFNTFVLKAKAGYTSSRKLKVFEGVDEGSTWFEGLRATDPLFEEDLNGWFFEVGLGLKFGGM